MLSSACASPIFILHTARKRLQFAEGCWNPSGSKTQTRLLHKSLQPESDKHPAARLVPLSQAVPLGGSMGIGGPGREAAGGQSRQQQRHSAGTAAATPLTSTAAGSAPPRPGEAPGTLGHSGPAGLPGPGIIPDIPRRSRASPSVPPQPQLQPWR